MNYFEQLKNLIVEKNGFVVTSDLTERGIPREYLRRAVSQGILEKIDRGAYIAPNTIDDDMYRLQMRFKSIIYSHDTALYFNGLSDRDPIEYTVTVYSGYRTTKLKENGLKVFSVQKDLLDVGVIRKHTAFGHEIQVYNSERALCDCIRNRNQMDIAIITDALKRYTAGKQKNIPLLMRYAEMFKVDTILRGYLEVLL